MPEEVRDPFAFVDAYRPGLSRTTRTEMLVTLPGSA